MRDPTEKTYTREHISHWNGLADSNHFRLAKYYHKRIEEILKFIVAPNQKVLELGCGNGDLLAALKPKVGVGVDFSEAALHSAREKYPDISFVCGDAHTVALEGKFDAIILNDLLNDVWDVQALLKNIHKYCHNGTNIIINTYSKLWQPVLGLARTCGLAKPLLQQNWLTPEDIGQILHLEGYYVVKKYSEILLPVNIPIVSKFVNKFLSKLFPFKYFNLTNIQVAKIAPEAPVFSEPKVSVIVAARNEEGNIPILFSRIPQMGAGTEIVFVEGGSTDNTYKAIEAAIADNPRCNAKLFRQTGKGKGDAVRLGFNHAEGDILMILDADMTVPPEDLPKFYKALADGKGDFINGVRLVYPMEGQAMRFFNLIGNKFFSLAFSWLLGQLIKDTLCGTKVLSRENYQKIAANRSYFGDFDPFGDFDLIFGAAKQHLKIVDLPIRYRDRKYGDTNISRWKHGLILLRMVFFAARKIKFI
ncbi:MAG: glycosyltransferase [Acidobacteria bacterium]|nr:glycosyltransferase [Acidobacteriota bacterium]